MRKRRKQLTDIHKFYFRCSIDSNLFSTRNDDQLWQANKQYTTTNTTIHSKKISNILYLYQIGYATHEHGKVLNWLLLFISREFVLWGNEFIVDCIHNKNLKPKWGAEKKLIFFSYKNINKMNANWNRTKQLERLWPIKQQTNKCETKYTSCSLPFYQYIQMYIFI